MNRYRLLHLLTLTLGIAIGTAAGMAYSRHLETVPQQGEVDMLLHFGKHDDSYVIWRGRQEPIVRWKYTSKGGTDVIEFERLPEEWKPTKETLKGYRIK